MNGLLGERTEGVVGLQHPPKKLATIAEYVRVPFADVGPAKIPEWLSDDDAVLFTDSLPTGHQGAEMGDIEEGDVVVVFGAGPVGIFAAKSAWLMGAGRLIVVHHLDYRLDVATSFAQAETVNFTQSRSSGCDPTTRSPRRGSAQRSGTMASARASASAGPT